MSLDWNDLLISFLHDPPDKALDIRKHESRALTYAAAALSRDVTRQELHGLDDQLAAIAERLPMPTAGDDGERGVIPEDERLSVRHPISGHELVLKGCELAVQETAAVFSDLAEGIDDGRLRFLTFWRLLPGRLAAFQSWYGRVPADTRIPDHTIWNHTDITAGMRAALSETHGWAFLSLSVGPVQPFIASARSIRDLWTGSAILSWLTFQGLQPVISELGPTAVIFPSLRGTPLLDRWLRKQGAEKVPEPDVDAKKVPCIPNRFLAIVPWGESGSAARELAKRCEASVRDKWRQLADAVRKELGGNLSALSATWDNRWQEQIESFFDVRTAVLPDRAYGDQQIAELLGGKDFEEVQPNSAKVRRLADAIPKEHRPNYDQKSSGRWQCGVELSARLMEAERMIRHVPVLNSTVSPSEQFPPKCSLMGSYEQMGPANLEESRKFWEEASRVASIHGVGLRTRERFCAIALAKRFAAPVFLAKELGIGAEDLHFPDTATVAAAEWLKKDAREIDPSHIRRCCNAWSGQWLYWEQADVDPENECPREAWDAIERARKSLAGENKPTRPPAYFAILAMDGDNMGRWLRGEKAPTVREVLHTKIRKYYEGFPKAEGGLNAKRPLGPAMHMALSEALTNFAVRIVPDTVRRHSGVLIYSGGDDLLALLPARAALACADELKRAFRGERTEIIDEQETSGTRMANNRADEGYYRLPDGRDVLVMGPKATLSAGLAVVHYKEDLRQALAAARSALHSAKDGGRDALQLAVCRRSGEHSSVLCSWDTIAQIERWVQAFAAGASDRWAHHLRAESPTLEGLPLEAMQAEIRRQVDRAEAETRSLLGKGSPADAGAIVAAVFDHYQQMRASRLKEVAAAQGAQKSDGFLGQFFRNFITLVQSASFLARGRES